MTNNDTLRPWHNIWNYAHLTIEERDPAPNPQPGDQQNVMQRVVINDGAVGGVAVLWCGDKLVLERQERPIVGMKLWEFPRGRGEKTDASAKAAVLRELQEELGVQQVEKAQVIGSIYADTGTIANRIAVVEVHVENIDTSLDATDGEIAEVKLVTASKIQALIAAGELCDGITISAWALYQSLY